MVHQQHDDHTGLPEMASKRYGRPLLTFGEDMSNNDKTEVEIRNFLKSITGHDAKSFVLICAFDNGEGPVFRLEHCLQLSPEHCGIMMGMILKNLEMTIKKLSYHYEKESTTDFKDFAKGVKEGMVNEKDEEGFEYQNF